MKTTKFNAKSVEFRTIAKEGKMQVKTAARNIFFLQKELRNLARKNDFCDGKSVANVAKAVRNYTKGGSLFDLAAFSKDTKGRFCTVSKSAKCPSFGKDITNVTPEGWYYLQPVTLTLNGVFAAFCKVAAAEIKAIEKAEKAAICEEEKAEKAAIKAAKKAERQKERFIKELQKAVEKGIISEAEMYSKIKAL